jgi:ankyrin repeat protein
MTALLTACAHDDADGVDVLLAAGANKNAQDEVRTKLRPAFEHHFYRCLLAEQNQFL